MKDKFQKIESFEKAVLQVSPNTSSKAFRNINKNQWIEDSKWPFETYKKLNIFSLGQILPGSLNLWWDNIRIFLGNKKLKKRGYKNLIGYLILFPFSKKEEFDIYANAMFFKRNSKYVVLFYKKKSKNAQLIKLNLFQNNSQYFSNILQQEIYAHLIANKIIHPNVSTPTLISYNLGNNENQFIYSIQELIIGAKSIKYLSSAKIKKTYQHVFDFLLLFYFKNQFSFVKYSNVFYNKNQINNIIKNSEFPDNLFEIFDVLISKEKYSLYGRIHNDLSRENILYTKNKVFLIDWGESIETHWIQEIFKGYKYLDYKFLKSFYYRLINHYDHSNKLIYSFEEEVLISICLKIIDNIKISEDHTNNVFKKNIEELFLIFEKYSKDFS